MDIFTPPASSGIFLLRDLPQGKPVTKIAIGSGWPELDGLFKLYPEQLVLVSGYTGHGKSTFMLNLIAKLALEKKIGSFLYVPENERYLLEKMRLLWPGTKAEFQNDFLDMCSIYSSIPQSYLDPYHTIDWVLGKAEYCVLNHDRGIIFLDPWNELERTNKPPSQLMTDYIGDSLRLVKQFCRQYQVSVIIAVHPTKLAMQQERSMTIADIEGSMNWGNKADNILIISRSKTTAVVTSAKVREIGAGNRGSCQFSVDPNTGKFTPVPGSDVYEN
jgi:hypothetical protein